MLTLVLRPRLSFITAAGALALVAASPARAVPHAPAGVVSLPPGTQAVAEPVGIVGAMSASHVQRGQGLAEKASPDRAAVAHAAYRMQGRDGAPDKSPRDHAEPRRQDVEARVESLVTYGPVPEPSTAALSLVGLAALGLVGYRKPKGP